MQALLDGRQREVEERGHFAARLLPDVVQRDDVALFRRQGRDGTADETLDFVALDRIEGRRGVDDQALVIGFQGLRAAAATVDAVAVLADHRPQPRHERAGLPQRCEILENGKERFLGGVFRQVKVPEQ